MNNIECLLLVNDKSGKLNYLVLNQSHLTFASTSNFSYLKACVEVDIEVRRCGEKRVVIHSCCFNS